MFDNDDIERLKKIQLLKEIGLTLEEIAQVIELYFTDGQLFTVNVEVIEILKNHIVIAEEKIKELNIFKMEKANISKIESIIKNTEIKEEK